jgi:glycosyltransferase involved in cell wall biosynthesis
VPTLSVVIPAYNRERTIAATVESVLACGTDVEIVAVDDGSTDGTMNVLRGFGSRIVAIRQENAGPAAARNSGFDHSTGDAVSFLDSDDVWLPGVAAECMTAFRAHPEIDVLFCETLFGNAANGYRPLSAVTGCGRFERLLVNRLSPDLFALDRNTFVRAMIDRNQIFLGSAFFRREALKIGGGFDPELFGGEDYELCLRYAATHRFAFCTRPLAKYEKHPGGLSANPDRMAREFALAVWKFANAAPLSIGERRAAISKYRALAFGYGYRAYERGDIREARSRFSTALRNGGFAPKTAAYWLSCQMPGPMLRMCRRIWQGLHR